MKNSKFNRNQRKWGRAGLKLFSGIVVFAVTYALILPAITLDQSAAAREPGLTLAESFYEEAVFEEADEPEYFEDENEAAPEEDSFDAAGEAAGGETGGAAGGAAGEAAGGETSGAADGGAGEAAGGETSGAAGGAAGEEAGDKASEMTPGEEAGQDSAHEADASSDPAEPQPDTDETKSSKESPSIEMPAQTLEAKLDVPDGPLMVTVSAPEGALPSGSTLRAGLLDDNKAGALRNAAMALDDDSCESFTAVQLTFLRADGAEIKPVLPVRVTFAGKMFNEMEKLEVFCFDDAGNAARVPLKDAQEPEAETGSAQLVFDAEKNYLFAVAGSRDAAPTVDSPALFFRAELEDAGLIVEAAAPAGAFPAGTSMSVLPVYEQSVLDTIAEAVDGSVTGVAAVDITFLDAGGNRIEPACPIRVTMTSAAIAAAERTTIVHMDDTGKAEVIAPAGNGMPTETETPAKDGMPAETEIPAKDGMPAEAGTPAEDQVVFEAEAFSIYAIVETICTEYLSHNGTRYEVTVAYGPEANIPEGSTLSVLEFEEGTEEYEYARKSVLADKKEKNEFVDIEDFYLAALDISIIAPDGNEIEPAAAVQVDIKIKNLPEVEDLDTVKETLEVQHHVEVEDGVVIEKVFDGAVEGAYQMDTNQEIVDKGTVVDPDSVSDEDFLIPVAEDDLDLSFETDVFSTFTITWRNSGRTVTVHYVDENGTELDVSNTGAGVFGNMTENSSSPAFLIYDIEGYEYSYTYRNTAGNRIAPMLVRNWSGVRWQWGYMPANGTNTYELSNADNIYVVYRRKTAVTTGGTPSVDQTEEWPEGDDAPQFGKSSVNNGNGTNTISLEITAAEKPVQKSTPADVIVVFDVSGSMGDTMNGQTRLARAKTAVNTMADALLNGANKDVRMALVSFSTTATTVPATGAAFTSDYNTFRSRVNGLNANGGTNWEQALQLANTMPVRKNAAAFVVFVTDGDPTFRVSRGDYTNDNLDMNTDATYTYYRNNYIFGRGGGNNPDAEGRNFNFAVKEVSAIKNANKSFYAIGISNDVTKVQNLTTQGGVSADHAFIASDSTAMENAFKSITESIQSILGFGNVEITDGITSMTNAEMKVMQSVDPNSFKYYRYGGENNKYGADYTNKTEWTTRETDGCAAASYNESKGAVEWNMGSTFQLEDGVTYVVEFTVWPSQEAYDLVADLNNGIRTYAYLTDAEKEQIVELTPPSAANTGTYALKTNTGEVKAAYNKTTSSGGVVTVSDEVALEAAYHEGDLETMGLDSTFVTITKEWNNKLDGRQAESINLKVTKDGSDYIDQVTVNEDNDWTSGKEYISAGFISSTVNGYNVREKGHDYTVTEPETYSYLWELSADVYRPMVIDGTLRVLIKTDSPTGEEGSDYYVIDGHHYQVQDGAAHLTVTNDRRSFLNLSKTVTKDADAVDNPDPDAVFEYTITVTDIQGADVWFSASTGGGTDDEPLVLQTIESYSSNVTPEVRDGIPTGYYSVPSGKEFKISIKAGWNVRFINLPTGSSYSIQETGTGGDGFAFVSASASADDGGTAGTVSGDTVTGRIDKPNHDFRVSYTNKWLTKEIEIIKVDENGEKLEGAAFTLTRGSSKVLEFDSNAEAGEVIKLGKGTYCLTETAAPDGYIILSNKIYFNVNADGSVTLSDEDGNTDGIPYENVNVSNPPSAGHGTVTISNTPGRELPNTGGPGTPPYTLGGIALIMASALMYGFRMRRRRKEVNV